jgi:hypothetical protein
MGATIPGRLRTDDQYSQIALKRLCAWLRKCDFVHQCAGALGSGTKSKKLPTRVLEVSTQGDSIRLVDTRGNSGLYVALSHSWGTSHRLVTTKTNLADHMKRIRLGDLPATFKLAIELTRVLQVPYLWIDSLCIVQDDDLDWETEASKMGQVYANSYLTISALCSTDDSSGFCSSYDMRRDRPLVSSETTSTGKRCIPNAAPMVVGPNPKYKSCFVYRGFQEFGCCRMTHGSKVSNIYVTREWMPSSLKQQRSRLHLIGEFGGNFDPCADEPLSKRGWVLQERLLSPRTLHFGTDEMFWECQECLLAEDGAVFRREFPTLKGLVNAARSVDQTQRSARPPWPGAWFRVVEEYTRRDLTRNEDKLPGLSGLAHTIHESTGDEYLAGLWRQNLLQCLYWNVETHEPIHHCHDPEHIAELPPPSKSEVKAPPKYRAPSWSWAAIDARIKYWPVSKDSLVAEIIEAYVEPLGKDTFGRVISGWIKIKVCFPER